MLYSFWSSSSLSTLLTASPGLTLFWLIVIFGISDGSYSYSFSSKNYKQLQKHCFLPISDCSLCSWISLRRSKITELLRLISLIFFLRSISSCPKYWFCICFFLNQPHAKNENIHSQNLVDRLFFESMYCFSSIMLASKAC